MIEPDTVKLLRECDAGVKMGISSIDDVVEQVHSDGLRQRLTDCRTGHKQLESRIEEQLTRFQDRSKDPNPVAKGMSWMKTSFKMAMDDSDNTIADLMTDGCNMGVKSLNMYLNRYKAADEPSKDIAKRLIGLEEKLAADLREYL